MSTDKGEHHRRRKLPTDPKVAKWEVITDQSDPRMIKFKKERGEFEPGYHGGTTIKLQITEYEASPDEYQVTEKIGFVEGGPSLFDIPLLREMAEKAILKVNEQHKRQRWAQELHISFRDYKRSDRKAVLELWKKCRLTQAWEEPAKQINRRLKATPDLLLVCVNNDKIIASVMGRCDEDRGWIEYLGVTPSFRRKGIARQLLGIIEERLNAKGCSEVNLLIDPKNSAAIEFSHKVGYRTKSITLLGKMSRND